MSVRYCPSARVTISCKISVGNRPTEQASEDWGNGPTDVGGGLARIMGEMLSRCRGAVA